MLTNYNRDERRHLRRRTGRDRRHVASIKPFSAEFRKHCSDRRSGRDRRL
ncbi:MAG: hypothetical protein V3T30_08700 [Thermodesulfobacteriota bacterium]